MQNFIGIGGIIATILAAVISSSVTWYIAQKSKIERILSYKIYLLPIFSNDIKISNTNLKVLYNEKILDTPCLLCVDVKNTGNRAILEPQIKIYMKENMDKFPLYIESLPDGYDILWEIYSEDDCCCIRAKYINPNETIKARFLLSSSPQKKLTFSCPMKDLKVIDLFEMEKKEKEKRKKSPLERFYDCITMNDE